MWLGLGLPVLAGFLGKLSMQFQPLVSVNRTNNSKAEEKQSTKGTEKVAFVSFLSQPTVSSSRLQASVLRPSQFERDSHPGRLSRNLHPGRGLKRRPGSTPPRRTHPHGLRVTHVETGFVMPTTLSFFTWLVVTLVVAFRQITELYTFALCTSLCVIFHNKKQ